MKQEESMQLKRRKSLLGEDLCWTDYMSLAFTQNVSLYVLLHQKKAYGAITEKLTRCTEHAGYNGDTANGKHHLGRHAQGHERCGDKWVLHTEGMVRLCLL